MISKVAFIGTHGVGKTTLCYGLAARLQARDVSLEVVGEVARRCPLPINRETTLAAQSWILHTQIAEEILAASRHDMVICDRSVLDNYVYMLLAAAHRPLDGHLRPAGPRADRPRAAARRDALDRSLVPARGRGTAGGRAPRAPARLPRPRRPRPRGAWLEYVEEHVWSRLEPRQLELL
jgi:hypothetical protein